MLTPAELLSRAGQNNGRIAVVVAEEFEVLSAVKSAVSLGIVTPYLFGDRKAISSLAEKIGFDLTGIEIFHSISAEDALNEALMAAKEKKVKLLMKGNINTAVFLRGVLDKKYGLKRSRLLSHVALFFPAQLNRPVVVTDAALNIAPTLQDKIDIINNASIVLKKTGINNPKVAVLAHNEIVTTKVKASTDAEELKKMALSGEIQGCVVDGPIALDCALNIDACRHKKIDSPVGGSADILLCPDIVSANILYKALVLLADAKCAAIIEGATIPLVVASRAEDAATKLYSIALASIVANFENNEHIN